MAVTSVRIQLDGDWIDLAYNPATGRYEAQLTAPATSYHQPGGYYSLTAELSNDSGAVEILTGAEYPALRLPVRETQAPAAELISPLPGWLTTTAPVFLFSVSDEAGGSGIASIVTRLDGVETPHEAVEAEGAYTVTVNPAGLSQGPHTVSLAAADHDGNETEVSGAYIVDTVPPRLRLDLPDAHRVVDAAELPVSGLAEDDTAGVALAAVAVETVLDDGSTRPGTPVEITLEPGGQFAGRLPLAEGVNRVTVTVSDAAGLAASEIFDVIRLVTDRTQADVDKLVDLFVRGVDNWTESERNWWETTRCRRGGYDALDINRVNAAMDYINSWITRRGYLTSYAREPHRPWVDTDSMTATPAARYIDNINALRQVFPLPEDAPPTPANLDVLGNPNLGIPSANDIETILVLVDEVHRRITHFPGWQSGHLISGGFSA